MTRRLQDLGALAQARVYFQPFGRPWRDQKLGADGTWSTVDTAWNAMGWKRSVFERQTGSPTKWTLYKDFDPFGRPQTIQPPDGTGHNVTLTYAGTRQVNRTVKVKSATSEQPATTTERYDRQGRLWQVVEPSGAAGANVTTTYGYDVGGRLVAVNILQCRQRLSLKGVCAMKKSILGRRDQGWVGVGLLCVLVLGLFLWLAMTQDLLTRQSSQFSEKRFAEISPGMSLQSAIEILGAPIRTETLPSSANSDAELLEAHFFSYPIAGWPFYTQAWVVTDEEGTIVYERLMVQP